MLDSMLQGCGYGKEVFIYIVNTLTENLYQSYYTYNASINFMFTIIISLEDVSTIVYIHFELLDIFMQYFVFKLS